MLLFDRIYHEYSAPFPLSLPLSPSFSSDAASGSMAASGSTTSEGSSLDVEEAWSLDETEVRYKTSGVPLSSLEISKSSSR